MSVYGNHPHPDRMPGLACPECDEHYDSPGVRLCRDEGEVRCPTCLGWCGAVNFGGGDDYTDCRTCDGRGVVPCPHCGGSGEAETWEDRC